MFTANNSIFTKQHYMYCTYRGHISLIANVNHKSKHDTHYLHKRNVIVSKNSQGISNKTVLKGWIC